jgi:hypothetical protein
MVNNLLPTSVATGLWRLNALRKKRPPTEALFGPGAMSVASPPACVIDPSPASGIPNAGLCETVEHALNVTIERPQHADARRP